MVVYTNEGKPVDGPNSRRQAFLKALGLEDLTLKDLGMMAVEVTYALLGLIIVITFVLTGYTILTNPLPTAPQFYQSHLNEIANPVDSTQMLSLTINLNSTTLAAGSGITVLASIKPDPDDALYNDANNIPLPDFYRLWMDGTFCRRGADLYEHIPSCFFDLTKSSDNATWTDVMYRGNHTLTYATSGVFDIALGAGPTDEEDRIKMGQPFIHVEGIESTNSFILGRNTLSMSQATLGIASLAFATSFLTIYIPGLKYLRNKGFYKAKKRQPRR